MITIDHLPFAIIVTDNYRAKKFSSQQKITQNVDNFILSTFFREKLFAYVWGAKADEGDDNGANQGDQKNFVDLQIGLFDHNVSSGQPNNDEGKRGPRIFHNLNKILT